MTFPAKRLGILVLAFGFGGFFAARVCSAASATALVSATVLGPAGESTASGAVTLSRVGVATAPLEISRPSRRSSTFGSFRVGGGSSATFAVALPERAVVRSTASELEVSGLAAAGTRGGVLSSDGSSLVSVGGEVRVTASQAPGRYEGSFPVTIAYN
jgi:hypothetical protein